MKYMNISHTHRAWRHPRRGESCVESQNYRIMYSLVHTPTHTETNKCRERHYMSNQTIIIYCQVVLQRSTAPTEPQSHPLPTCAGKTPSPGALCSAVSRSECTCSASQIYHIPGLYPDHFNEVSKVSVHVSISSGMSDE